MYHTISVQSMVLDALAEEGELSPFYEFSHIDSHLISTVAL